MMRQTYLYFALLLLISISCSTKRAGDLSAMQSYQEDRLELRDSIVYWQYMEGINPLTFPLGSVFKQHIYPTPEVVLYPSRSGAPREWMEYFAEALQKMGVSPKRLLFTMPGFLVAFVPGGDVFEHTHPTCRISLQQFEPLFVYGPYIEQEAMPYSLHRRVIEDDKNNRMLILDQVRLRHSSERICIFYAIQGQGRLGRRLQRSGYHYWVHGPASFIVRQQRIIAYEYLRRCFTPVSIGMARSNH